MKRNLIVLIACAVTTATAQRAATRPPTSEARLAERLRGSDIGARMAAFDSLKRIPGAVSRAAASGALLSLLRQEDRVMISEWQHHPAGPRGRSVYDVYDEGYTEYVASVLGWCVRTCDKTALFQLFTEEARTPELRAQTMHAFMDVAVPAGGFSASQRSQMDDMLAEALTDKNETVRGLATLSLGGIVVTDKTLSQSDRARYHAAIVGRLNDSSPGVRGLGITALGRIADPADLPALQRVADSDPETDKSGRGTGFPLRDQARKVVADLKSSSSAKP